MLIESYLDRSALADSTTKEASRLRFAPKAQSIAATTLEASRPSIRSIRSMTPAQGRSDASVEPGTRASGKAARIRRLRCSAIQKQPSGISAGARAAGEGLDVWGLSDSDSDFGFGGCALAGLNPCFFTKLRSPTRYKFSRTLGEVLENSPRIPLDLCAVAATPLISKMRQASGFVDVPAS